MASAAMDQRRQGPDHALVVPLVGEPGRRREDQDRRPEVAEAPDVNLPPEGRAAEKVVSPLHRIGYLKGQKIGIRIEAITQNSRLSGIPTFR